MNKEKRIINGENIETFNNQIVTVNYNNDIQKKLVYNFYCSFTDYNSNKPFAGGCYLGKNIVLTAAHIFHKIFSVREYVVRFNKNNINDPGISFKIKKILIHPEYSSVSFDNDIAIVYLDKNPIDYKIRRIFLPSSKKADEIYKIDKVGYIMGFGLQNPENNNSQPNTVKISEIRILNQNFNKYPKNWITENMITAGDFNDLDDPFDNEDACQGDSGGPFFGIYGKNKEPILMGIVSWGVSCGKDELPGVYTKVGNYTNWVYRNWNLN